MAFTYVVTSQKPTAVEHSLLCCFTSPFEQSLIVAKNNRIEVHALQSDGLLTPIMDELLYGHITALNYYRPLDCGGQDVLVVLFEKKTLCVLGYDADTKTIVTRARISVKDFVGTAVEFGHRCIIDPEHRAIACLLIDGP